eukprot:m.3032 g.3032  ORF g.3032 m.3032 type:complete len:582 (+) comp2008_c0_seq1:96-1841(+)
MNVKLSLFVEKAILDDSTSKGVVIGVDSHALALIRNETSFSKDIALVHHLPSYVSVIGVFAPSAAEGKELLDEVNKTFKDATLCLVSESGSAIVSAFKKDDENNLAACEYAVAEYELPKSWVELSIHSPFHISSKIFKNSKDTLQALRQQLDSFMERIGGNGVSLYLPQADDLVKLSEKRTCERICTKESDLAVKGKKVRTKIEGIVNAKVLWTSTSSNLLTSARHKVDVMSLSTSQTDEHLTLEMDIFTSVFIEEATSISVLRSSFIKTLLSRLNLFWTQFSHAVEEFGTIHLGVNCLTFDPFPLRPVKLWVPFIFPAGDDDQAQLLLLTQDARKNIQHALCLPINRPFLRPINSLESKRMQSQSNRLRNPHKTIKYQPLSGGELHLVQGDYDYYHYMQDHINDDMWGCAYRSCQTICSWYYLQGYTSKQPPSHVQIQEMLVKLKDKQEDFIGSSKWIGSQEIFLVLTEWLKDDFETECRFIPNVLGMDLAIKSRELAHHFDTAGTPIMIGGASLAHTILGIDWDDQRGTVRWLILDPHYKGDEDLKIIHKKGWCNWKEEKFWSKRASYNILLPARPDLL